MSRTGVFLVAGLAMAGCTVESRLSTSGGSDGATFFNNFDKATPMSVKGLGTRVPDANAGSSKTPPPLEWRGAPTGTKSFVVVVEDPDAPEDLPFVHWLFADIPAGSTSVNGGVPGINGVGEAAYFGPNPPHGQTHSYHFQVFAMDTTLGLKRGFSRTELEDAMEGHVIGKGEIVASFASGIE
jgi:Raf kinase inhibitor-like YbhB/YbcL family protein